MSLAKFKMPKLGEKIEKKAGEKLKAEAPLKNVTKVGEKLKDK